MNTFEYLVTMAVLRDIHKKEAIRLTNEKIKVLNMESYIRRKLITFLVDKRKKFYWLKP